MAASGPTVSHVIADLAARFTRVDPDTARLDARLLVAHALGADSDALFSRSALPIPTDTLDVIEALAARRMAHEPVSRIVGRRAFWGMDFVITPEVLDPRPDTETVVAAVLEKKRHYTNPRILDLGTGSGCILLAILKDWPEASGVGVDVSPGAVAAAADNAARLGLAGRASFRASTWCEGLDERFDIIVGNPPYIAESELVQLAPNVARYDPRTALAGGPDGLSAYRALIPGARALLRENGRIFLEIGTEQAAKVSELLIQAGFRPPETYRDLGGIVRCLGTIPA